METMTDYFGVDRMDMAYHWIFLFWANNRETWVVAFLEGCEKGRTEKFGYRLSQS